ncbi:MAG: glycosyltransferase [Geminicoccaceae bacterium]
MILVAVGTYIQGFDELVTAADTVAAELGLPGFAQIGHSRVVPVQLAWERFLTPAAMAARIAAASLVLCHGGIGLLGEAMRAGKPIIAMPRRGRPTARRPAGDQTAVIQRLAARYPIGVCEQPEQLAALVRDRMRRGLGPQRYDLSSDVPELVASFLARTSPSQPSTTLLPKRSARS